MPYNLSIPSVQSYLFADDLNVCFKSRSNETLETQLISTSFTVQDWCSANLLCINSDKIQNMILSYNRNDLNSENNSDAVNFLGFLIDKHLSWEDHILRVASKVSKGVYLMRRLRICVSLGVLKTVYYAHVHSHLSYGILLWGHQSLCMRLLKLQKVCVRLMCGLPFHGHCRSSFVRLGIMTVTALFIFQSLKENSHLYDELGSSHTYKTRNRNLLGLVRCNCSKTQKTFYYMSIKLYNVLPISIKLLPFLKFKNVLRKILTENCIYKLDEFFEIKFDCYG